ncbi:NUDIX hydrolase [Polymorphospora sp. NPDC050346]|uniref:NUDIX hydrolase n=1 Tax=Polymorphospora sp. NPDC050346 TaxID=3155780 RepID=UPI0033DF27F9
MNPMRIVGRPERLATVGDTSLDLVTATLPTYAEPWVCGLVRRPGAVAVLPYDVAQGIYVLARQPRIGLLGAVTVEAPAGKIDHPDDDPAETAARELQEEMGLLAANWTTVAEAVTVSPGYTTERMWLYLAEGLTTTPARPVDAYIDTIRLPLSELDDHLDRYRRDDQADLKTLTLLQALQVGLTTR